MEVADGGRTGSCQTVAVLLVMCLLAPSLKCFSLLQLSKTVEPAEDSGKVRTGIIIFNGAEFKSQLGSSPAIGNEDMLRMDLHQTDAKGMPEQDLANAWKRLNTSLHCGQHWMKLKAIGPGAIDLQLDTGSTSTLPLIQVPTSCGYSMQQNALGLVLVVPYDACNVIQENGQYVLPAVWHQTPVKFACPMASTASAFLEQQSLMTPFPPTQLRSSRHKRHVKSPLSYDYTSPYNPHWYSYYLSLGKDPSATQPAVQDPYQYGYYPYLDYYKSYHSDPYYASHPIQTNVDAYSSQYPTFTQYPYQTQDLYVPDAVENPDVYYYPIIQYFYGKNPNLHWLTTEAPTTTAPTTTTRPCYSSTTTTTTKPCHTTTKPPKRCYPGRKCPFVPFSKDPFHPVVSYRSQVPDADKYMQRQSVKSRFPTQKQTHTDVSWQPLPWLPQSTGQDLSDWGQQHDYQI